MGRKVLALPKAMLSFFVLTTYHLGLALIDGLPKLKDGDATPIKAHLYSVVRDIQEGLGYIVSIFSDTYGQYIIQESQFHLQYYYSTMLQEKTSSSSSSASSASSSASAIYDKSPAALDFSDQRKVRDKFPLTDYKSSSSKLASLDLEEFKIVFDILYNEYEFFAYSLVPVKHANSLNFDSMSDDDIGSLLNYESREKIMTLTPEQLLQVFKGLNDRDIMYITDDQLNQNSSLKAAVEKFFNTDTQTTSRWAKLNEKGDPELFTIVGLEKGATQSEVRRAYREKLLQLDIQANPIEARQISKSYFILFNRNLLPSN